MSECHVIRRCQALGIWRIRDHSASNERSGTDLLHDELCHQVRKAGEGAVNHLKGIEAYQVI